jgi:two-component system NtrC family sensor kinase
MNTTKIHDAILNLTQSSSIDEGRVEEIFQRVVELAAVAADVERVSIWMLSPSKEEIVCENLYLLSKKELSSPKIKLSKNDFPNYFLFFSDAKILSADDAHTHPNTFEFSKGYLTPLGITSMLDVPLKNGSSLVGVICFEHVGPQRTWTVTEKTFASILSELVSKTILAKERDTRAKEFLQASRLASLGEMSTMLAHEINNPLAAAAGFINLVAEELKGPNVNLDAALQRLEKAALSCERIAKLVKNLKLFARIDDLSKSENPLINLINDSLDLIRHKADLLGIKLITNCAADIKLHCSGLEITQVFVNLLANASDAIAEKPQKDNWIKIDVQANPSQLLIRVANSGEKIPAATADKIFDPFFTTKPVGKGTGIGLKISRQIVANHNGKLHFDRTAPNTTFLIELPLSAANAK